MIVLASGFVVEPVANAAFPGQNGRIAYVTGVDDHRVISTVDATGADPQPLIDLGSGRDAINPSWSWDGTRIAFAGQTSAGGPFAIYTANADGSGNPNQVTTPLISDTDPTWEPAGGQIAFVRAHPDGSSRIFIVDLASLAVRALGSSQGTDLEPAWSPEGLHDRLRLEGVPARSLPPERMPIQPLDRIRRREWACRWGSLWLLHVLGLAPPGLVSGRYEDRCALRPGRDPPVGPFGHPAFRRKLRTPDGNGWAVRDHVGTLVLT
jgi:dipeptidyl aminopeptidase/acylaminoacyl peptidase